MKADIRLLEDRVKAIAEGAAPGDLAKTQANLAQLKAQLERMTSADRT